MASSFRSSQLRFRQAYRPPLSTGTGVVPPRTYRPPGYATTKDTDAVVDKAVPAGTPDVDRRHGRSVTVTFPAVRTAQWGYATIS